MRLTLLMVISVVLSYSAVAQSKPELASRQNRIKLLLKKSEEAKRQNPKRAIIYAEQAYRLAKLSHDKVYLIPALKQLSNLLWTVSDYPDALGYALEWLKNAKSLNQTKEVIDALNMVGIIHDAQKNYKEALSYYRQVLSITRKSKDEASQARTLNNIGELYKARKDFSTAEKYYLKALKLNRRSKALLGTAVSLNNIGELEFQQGKYVEALYYFKRSRKIKQKLGNRKGLSITLNNIAKTYHKTSNAQKALLYARKSLNIARKAQSKLDIKLAYQTLSYAYQEKGNYKKALYYFQKYSKLKAELFRISKEERISHLAAQYKLDEHKKEIEFLEQRQYFLYLIFVIIFLTALILILLFYNQKKLKIKKNKEILKRNKELSEAREAVRKANQTLQASNINLEEKVKERTLSLKKINKQLVRSNREIDIFLYRISHDFWAPIATLKGLQHIGKTHTQNTFLLDIFGKMGETLRLTENMVNKLLMVNTINHKSSESRDRFTTVKLKPFLNNIIENLCNQEYILKKAYLKTNIKSDFEITSDRDLLDIIFENLFENAILYSKKGNTLEVEVVLYESKTHYQISVLDRGIGMSQEVIEKAFSMFFRGSNKSRGNGLGLYVVKRAINKLKGNINIESSIDSYTKVNVSLNKT